MSDFGLSIEPDFDHGLGIFSVGWIDGGKRCEEHCHAHAVLCGCGGMD